MNKTAKTIARTAITAGLGLSMTLGTCAASPIAAFAENGTLTISQLHNEGATYDAYMVFQADISEDNKASNVQWAADDMKRVVLSFLDQNGYNEWLSDHHSGNGQHDLAQNACEFIAFSITGSAEDVVAATTPRTTAGLSFANRLAQALASSNVNPRETATAGTTFNQPEGYWLFVTTDSTTNASGEVGTAPMWVPLGGSTKTIQEKSSVPSIAKDVQEDSTGRWGKVADANVGQELSYRLTAKLPANYAAFNKYHLKFTDTLSEGLVISTTGNAAVGDLITVKIGSQQVAVDGTHLKASYENNTLTVEFVDLKSDHWNNLTIAGDETVSVEYQAHITSEGNLGSLGNTNTVTLTYTDDPVSEGEGTIEPGPTTKTFAYQIKLVKLDGQTKESLSGASFTVQVADSNSDDASKRLYVQADGSLAQQPATFVTGTDGSFLIPGIDEGTYLIRETAAPAGYERIAEDITLTVNSTLDGAELSLRSLTASTGDETQEGTAAVSSEVKDVDPSTGIITLNVDNDHWLLLPLTGQEGLTSVAAIGAIITSTAGAGLWWRRRNSR